MCRWILGMNGLGRREAKTNPEVTSDRCRLCSGPEDELDEIEDAEHLTFKCNRLIMSRVNCFSQWVMEKPYLWKVKELRRFLKNRYIINLENNCQTEGQTWEELRNQVLIVNELGELELIPREGVG